MNDLAFQLVTALSPADCKSRIATAIEKKVWILTGEPRWESIYMTGSITSDAFILREHRAWHDSPTYVAASLQPAKNGAIIDGRCVSDPAFRWLPWLWLGIFLLAGAPNLFFVVRDFRNGPFHFSDLVTHSAYRTGILTFITMNGSGLVILMFRINQRRESHALKRFLVRLLEGHDGAEAVDHRHV